MAALGRLKIIVDKYETSGPRTGNAKVPKGKDQAIRAKLLGFSAKETAGMLETTVASVNSALQRARAAVAERVPERSQQATLKSLGNEEVRELVGRYVDAWERCDIEAFAAMLAQDATFAMPPRSTMLSPISGASRAASSFHRIHSRLFIARRS